MNGTDMADTWSESEVLGALHSADHLGKPLRPGSLGVGDDAAVVALGGVRIAACTDALNEGIHFQRSYFLPEDIGYKVAAVNLSDLAAMGATPLHLLLTVSAPHDYPLPRVIMGVIECCTAFDVSLIGGDTSASSGAISVTATALGSLGDATLTRGGARPGDHILLTGPIGLSGAGLASLSALGYRPDTPDANQLAHLRPVPRVREGALANVTGATAAIDISDGLGLDLHRLADRSNVGFELFDIPVGEGIDESAALSSGEDFELVITTPDPRRLIDAFATAGLGTLYPIGRIHSDASVRTLRGRSLAPLGYVH